MSGLPTPAVASIGFAGSTSGTVTVEAPAVAGTRTVAFPAASGTLSLVLTGTSGSLGGSALTPGNLTTTTVTITGAATGMVVAATPSTFPGNDCYWFAYVSAANTVTVAVGVVASATPTASIYNLRIIQ